MVRPICRRIAVDQQIEDMLIVDNTKDVHSFQITDKLEIGL